MLGELLYSRQLGLDPVWKPDRKPLSPEEVAAFERACRALRQRTFWRPQPSGDAPR